MSPKVYEQYCKECAMRGVTPFPNDMGTPPDVFGRSYLGSSKKRHNGIRRKRMAKMLN